MILDDAPDTDLPDELLPNPVDAVVFDLGNVLLRWDPAAAIAATVGPERATVFLTDPSFGFDAWNRLQDSGRSWADGIADKLRTHPHYETEMRAYVDGFASAVAEPIEGSVQLLRELHEAGVPLIALTNWSEELLPVALEQHDFLDLFDDIVVSGEEGVAKPDPAIFNILQDRVRHLGGLDDCIFIDDNVDNVQAATLAGMDAIHFTGPAELRADLRVRGLPVRTS